MKKIFMSVFVPFSVLMTLVVLITLAWIFAESAVYGETHYDIVDSIGRGIFAYSLYKNLGIKFTFGEGWNR